MKRSYTVPEVAQACRISRRNTYRILKKGKLSFMTGKRRISVETLPEDLARILRGEDRLIRIGEVAGLLGASRSSIYRWFWEGKLKGIKLPWGAVRILESEIRRILTEGTPW